MQGTWAHGHMDTWKELHLQIESLPHIGTLEELDELAADGCVGHEEKPEEELVHLVLELPVSKTLQAAQPEGGHVQAHLRRRSGGPA